MSNMENKIKIDKESLLLSEVPELDKEIAKRFYGLSFSIEKLEELGVTSVVVTSDDFKFVKNNAINSLNTWKRSLYEGDIIKGKDKNSPDEFSGNLFKEIYNNFNNMKYRVICCFYSEDFKKMSENLYSLLEENDEIKFVSNPLGHVEIFFGIDYSEYNFYKINKNFLSKFNINIYRKVFKLNEIKDDLTVKYSPYLEGYVVLGSIDNNEAEEIYVPVNKFSYELGFFVPFINAARIENIISGEIPISSFERSQDNKSNNIFYLEGWVYGFKGYSREALLGMKHLWSYSEE